MEKDKIFVSYAREDAGRFALKLAGDLKNAGAHIWIDQSDIQAGTRWDHAIEEALKNSACILFIASQHSVTSVNVLDEISIAIQANKMVIPIIVDDCHLPFMIRRLNYIDFRENYDVAFDNLLKSLNINKKAQINFQLEIADVAEFEADVLVLKYAQAKHGVDKFVSSDLIKNGIKLNEISPSVGQSVLVMNIGTTRFNKILFIGVRNIVDFGYQDIKNFAAEALGILEKKAVDSKHIAMTIHGVGFGLDEDEALLSQIAGLFEALQAGDFPKGLNKISIIDNNTERIIRLQKVLDKYLKDQPGVIKENSKNFIVELNNPGSKEQGKRLDKIINAGRSSEKKKHIFVAMPFKSDMYDTFYYGIKQPINSNGFLCERIDEDTFTGDILAKMKSKIETASAVVADLTTQNPNVYLEVGYAWGIRKATILIVKKGDEVKFDVQGQKCLQYEGIKNLEDILTKEIKGLIEKGEID